MASVLDFIECPHCGQDASLDFYWKTGEEFVDCNNCGYHKSVTIINRDKELSELTEADYVVKELKNPYGAYRLKLSTDIGCLCGSFADKEQYDYFCSEIIKEQDLEYCSTSRFVDGQIVTEVIVDNRPTEDKEPF